MKMQQVEELVLQSLEHELGGVKIYEAAIRRVIQAELKTEWQKYLEQTRKHVERLRNVCKAMQIDAGKETPGRVVVRENGAALVRAIELAASSGTPEAAQLVACEAVVLAETKDHQDWELLSKVAEKLGDEGAVLRDACEETEDEEDEHLYHSRGWCRELWIQSLGLPPVLPPPEETRDVKTAIGAARAQHAADKEREAAPK